jgi:galactose-1-phosphate uridylyltransferase
MIHPGAVVLAHPEDVSPRARAAAAAESAMTVASLQEELRETKRRLEAYRGARMASRLIHTQKKTAAALIEENPALAIPARLKEEARDAALALEHERSRIAELEREVEKTREEMKNAVRDAHVRAEERVRAAEEEASLRIDDARINRARRARSRAGRFDDGS